MFVWWVEYSKTKSKTKNKGHKYDEKYVKDLQKKGWEIEEFNLTSSGYEIWIIKGGKKVKYTDKKSPSKALKLASEKAK